jgi:hypothetical protein
MKKKLLIGLEYILILVMIYCAFRFLNINMDLYPLAVAIEAGLKANTALFKAHEKA